MRKRVLLFTLALLCSTSAVFADAVYLKDGRVVRGKIVQEDNGTVMFETGDTWQRIDRNTIELIKKDDTPAASPAPAVREERAVGAAAPVKPAADTPRPTPRNESGWYFGFQLPYNKIGGDFDGAGMPAVDGGLGLGLILGYEFTPRFGLEIDWAGSGHESAGADIGFGEFSINMKFRFLPDEAARPFLFAGVGAFVLGDDSLTFGGTGYNLGLGLDFRVGEQNTIGLALIRKIITYDEIVKSDTPLTLRGEINGDTTSIRFDFTHHF